jgi:hypothetical protein
MDEHKGRAFSTEEVPPHRETSGWAWPNDGTAYELMELDRQEHRIWPIISTIAFITLV